MPRVCSTGFTCPGWQQQRRWYVRWLQLSFVSPSPRSTWPRNAATCTSCLHFVRGPTQRFVGSSLYDLCFSFPRHPTHFPSSPNTLPLVTQHTSPRSRNTLPLVTQHTSPRHPTHFPSSPNTLPLALATHFPSLSQQ